MNSRITGSILCVTALASSALSAGFAISEQSPAAMGTAGAYSAAQSASSIYYNPAGIAGLSGRNFEGDVHILMPSTDLTGPTNRPGYRTESMESETFVVPGLFYAHELSGGHTMGLGVFAYMGLGVTWEEDWVGREEIEEIGLQAITVNPTWGYRLKDNLRVGAGLSVTHGDVHLSRDTYSGGAFNTYIDADMEGAGWAFGYNLGLQYDMDEKTTFALSWRSPITLAGEGEAEFSWPELDNPTQQGLLSAQFPTTDLNLDVEMPGILMAGVSHKLNPQLVLRGDFVLSTWSAYEELYFDFETETSLLQDSRSPKEYEDTMALRLGGEWQMNPATILRFGYYYEEEAVKDELVEPSLPDGARNGFSVGMGYALKGNQMLDVYFLLVSLQARESTFASFPGVYETSIPILGLGWSKSF